MNRRRESVTQLREFAALVAPSVYRLIAAREAGYRLFGWITKNEGQHCRAVVFSVDDNTLRRYGIMRAGAFIQITPGDEASHAYFAHETDPTVVLDFCSGFLAASRGDSINNWRRHHPRLFHQRALLGNKDDIARHLKLVYPRRDTDFWQHFYSR